MTGSEAAVLAAYKRENAAQDRLIAAQREHIEMFKDYVATLGVTIRGLAGLLEQVELPDVTRKSLDCVLLKLACVDLESRVGERD